MSQLVSRKAPVVILSLIALSACGMGSQGDSKTKATQTTTTSTGSTSGTGTSTGMSSSPTYPADPNIYSTPHYALYGRFVPGDSNLLAPQKMTWGHTSVVARVTHTTQVGVTLTEVQGTGTYTLTAQNETDMNSTVTTFAQDGTSGTVSGLNPNVIYTVTFLKHTEAMYNTAVFNGFTLDTQGGYLAPPIASTRRMEVYGDSISAGYGALAPNSLCLGDPTVEDSEVAYGPVAAATLGADVHVIAWSGKGVSENHLGTAPDTMPQMWQRADATDSNSTWDTNSWIPQVVVIDLGENDFTNVSVDQNAFVQDYTTFLANLRSAYPEAAIVVTIGTIPLPVTGTTYPPDLLSYLQQAISARNAAGDKNISYLQFAVENVNTGVGCEDHPNVATQASTATQLVTKIKTLVPW